MIVGHTLYRSYYKYNPGWKKIMACDDQLAAWFYQHTARKAGREGWCGCVMAVLLVTL